MRPVEQTPELAHLVGALPLAYPEARVVHIVRDGRDVVCSLLEKTLASDASRRSADDAGVAYGAYARFWVEPERRDEFEAASDARRAAWVWRSYVTRRASGGAQPRGSLRAHGRRPGRASPASSAATSRLPVEPLAAALRDARMPSRSAATRRTSSAEQLADVEAEAGDLLRELGYVK